MDTICATLAAAVATVEYMALVAVSVDHAVQGAIGGSEIGLQAVPNGSV
jgi:hypothetical protein